jgi:hypothetical protein
MSRDSKRTAINKKRTARNDKRTGREVKSAPRNNETSAPLCKILAFRLYALLPLFLRLFLAGSTEALWVGCVWVRVRRKRLGERQSRRERRVERMRGSQEKREELRKRRQE